MNHRGQLTGQGEMMATVDDFSTAVIAGTGDPAGVDTLIIDRSDLPEGFRVFVRAVNPGLMELWANIVKEGAVTPAPPLLSDGEKLEKGSEEPGGEQAGLTVTLRDPVRLHVQDESGQALLIRAATGTRMEIISDAEQIVKGEPAVSLGRVQGKEVIFFDGGVPAIELPMRLPPAQYFPLVLGVARPENKRVNKELRASQRMGNGEVVGGYSIFV